MRTRKILFGLAIAILATNSLVAQDDMSAEKALARATETTTAQMMKTFARAELTEEQQASAVTIIENHIASLVAAKDAQAATLTEEQIAKKRAAWDQGKADGLKGKKLYAAANDAMGLTEEQQAVYDAAKEKIKTVNTTIRTEIRALLTEEQVAAMPVKAGKKRAKKTAESTPQTVSLKLPNMTWHGCAGSVRTALTAVDGITDIETNVEENSCSFTAPDGMDVAATLNEIVESGVKQVKDWKLAE